MTRLCACALVLGLVATLQACSFADQGDGDASISIKQMLATYADIRYKHCIGYDGDDTHESPNPSACTAKADCNAVCPPGKSCECDKSCGCCVVDDWGKGPESGKTYYRYAWTACKKESGKYVRCDKEYSLTSQYTWFSTASGLKTSQELVDEMCMMHVEPAKKGCIYRTTAKGKNCSLPSTGGAGTYECGNKVCSGKPAYQCDNPPTDKFTYKLVGDECK